LNWFVDTQDKQRVVPVRRIVYSTMKGSDLTIAELATTNAELVSAGFRAIEVASEPPLLGDPLEAVGAPVGGIVASERYLRRSLCTLETQANVVEQNWIFANQFRHSCTDVLPGASGSPLLSRRTGQVIAITGTSTAGIADRGGNFDCSLNHPCELNADGTAAVLYEVNYSTPVIGVGRCFGPEGFNVMREGCPLDEGRQFAIAGFRRVSNGFAPNSNQPLTWNATLTSETLRYYRYKAGRQDSIDCRDPRGYSDPVDVRVKNRIDDVIGTDPGRYFLCVVGGPTAVPDASWQPMRFASVLFQTVDRQGPLTGPEAQFTELDPRYLVRPVTNAPDLAGYRYKIEPAQTANCDVDAGYRDFLGVPLSVPKDPPAVLCLKGLDEAGNSTMPQDYRLTGERFVFWNGVRNFATDRPEPLVPGGVTSIEGLALADRTESSAGGASILAGVRVNLLDSAGQSWNVPLLLVSPQEIRVVVPERVALGPATITLIPTIGQPLRRAVPVSSVAPGMFSLNSEWVYGTALTVRAGNSLVRQALVSCSGTAGQCSNTRVKTDPAARIYLELFGTAFRNARTVSVRVNGVPVEVLYAGPAPGLAGVDQVNVALPAGFQHSTFSRIDVQAGDRVAPPVYVAFEQ
jgi:uncharacterized protein (TIGR03437 family)